MGVFERFFRSKDAHTPNEEVTRLCQKAGAAIERDEVGAAIKDLTRAEALDPRDPWVQLLLHQAYGRARDIDSSAKHFQALRELDPATAEELLESMPESLQAKMKGQYARGREDGSCVWLS